MSDNRQPRPPELVPGVFADREQAELAIAELRRLGFADSDVGVAVLAPGRYQHMEHTDRQVVQAVGTGVGAGASLGSIAGMTLVSATAGEVLALGVGGLLLGATGGLIWGGVIGGLLGVILRVRRRPEEDRWCEVPLESEQVLVVARIRPPMRTEAIAAMMHTQGATCVLDQSAVDHTWRELEVEHPSGQPAPDGAPA